MKLNTLQPAPGAKQERRRLGRGIGSGLGKTGGRGHKGQHARTGRKKKAGFEGGQMPLQRRLPKSGFRSLTRHLRGQVRLDALARVEGESIDLSALKACGLVAQECLEAKVMLAGTLDRPVVLRGVAVTRGARAAIEAAGGRIED